jgi:hypothetical protein
MERNRIARDHCNPRPHAASSSPATEHARDPTENSRRRETSKSRQAEAGSNLFRCDLPAVTPQL